MSLMKPQELIDEFGVDGLCDTADDYFEGFELSFEQMRKPFSNLSDAPRLLRNLGTLLDGAHLRRGMTVLDFGAGTCWLSRYMAQMGCATVSVDPSGIALDLGRQWFERNPPALMPKPPQFLVFDGHKIALPDESVDRVLCFDAFHHVPNPAEVIAEFARVLKPGGMAGFSEPGPHHSKTAQSQMEMRDFKVLENDIAVEDLERYALASGFTNVWVDLSFVDSRIPLTPGQVSAIARRRKYPPLRVMLRFLRAAMDTLTNQHFIYMAKGPLVKDSRWVEGLNHELHLVDAPKTALVNEEFTVRVQMKNTGFARWICADAADVGNVNLALRRKPDGGGELEEIQRFVLPHSVDPGETLQFDAAIRWTEPGALNLHVDLVAEQISWFEQRGSKPVELSVEIKDA